MLLSNWVTINITPLCMYMFGAVINADVALSAVTVLTSPDLFTYAYVAAEARLGRAITNMLETAILAITMCRIEVEEERFEVVIRIFVLSLSK